MRKPFRNNLKKLCAAFALGAFVVSSVPLGNVAVTDDVPAAKFIIAAIAYAAVKIGKKDKTADERDKCGFAWGVFLIVLSTLLSGMSYILQLNGSKNLPATVLYPLITGGTLVFSTVAGIIFFKEKFQKG